MVGSRKHRPPNPPLNASTANPSAASAALTAFSGTRRESSSGSLSAAAAAAALRARPTTPTNVAGVQTKRTARRSPSAASSVSGADPNSRPGLRRQSSSGSMTERTFRRSPSPGTTPQRSLSSGGQPRTPYAVEMEQPPPVPAIPESVNMAAARARGGQRPKSLGFVSTPVRTASQKMAGQGKETGGSWFGAATVGDLESVRTSDAIMSSPPRTVQSQAQPAQTPETIERPESGGSSINFSYPARVRVASPTAASPPPLHEGSTQSPVPERQPKPKRRSSTKSPQRGGSVRSSRPSSIASDQTLVYDPNSRRMVPRAEVVALEQQVHAASEKRPKKKKVAPNRSGSHLAKGPAGRSHGTAVGSGVLDEAAMAAAASLRSHRAEGQQQAVPEPEEEYVQPAVEAISEPQSQQPVGEVQPEPPAQHTEISKSPVSNAPEVFPLPLPDSHDGSLQRRPSVVREEDEQSDSDVDLEAPVATPPTASAALDAVPVRHNIYAHGVPSPPQSEITDDQVVETFRPAPVELVGAATASPEPTATAEKEVVAEPREMQNLRRDSRTHSNSPVRSARFGPIQDTLTIRHEPPARSLSPRKSALKQSSPSRGASPTDDQSETSGVDNPIQEPPVQRKKSVRVSFDDENTVVVGEAAGDSETDGPAPPSPQQITGRRPWYSTLGIGRKKDAAALEEDEVMKPRPALPSFGSVRGRKQSPKPAEERPLVRPHEPFSEPSSPELEKKTVEAEATGQSTDHALGAIIHEQGLKNGANISKIREPLPPVVTSIEGYGYTSDSASSDDEAALLADTPKLEAEESHVSQASTLVPEQSKPHNGSAAAAAAGEGAAVDVEDFGGALASKPDAVPAISVTQPSPRPEQTEQERMSYIHFPGQFPETETETEGEGAAASSTTPARQVTFEPVVQLEDATATSQTPGTVLATQPAIHEDMDDSDGSSLYSDAYEDLSEIEGDGFQSLDAVVKSPMLTTTQKNVLEEVEAEARRAEVAARMPQPRDVGEAHAATPPTGPATTEPIDHWAAAKAYWRSLTADKRAQLEKEAAEEAGTEADLEEAQPEAKKPRRKKSVEKRNAEKKAIEERRTAVDPSRTYMIKPGTKAAPGDYGLSAETVQGGQQQQMSGKADAGMRLRKTMRAVEATPVETGTRMRRSMRTEAPERPAPKQRPVSLQPLGNTTEITSSRHSRAMSEDNPSTGTGMPSILQPSLRRRGSDSSASSFKRSRPMSSSFGFRKTMRRGSGSVDPPEYREQQSSRFSLRGMSPGRQGASPPVSMGTRMRTTLRTSGRRGSEDSGKGYLRFSGTFGRPSDKKGKQKSRFGDDSSDEDEVVPRRFTSRFEDSSDEDMAPAESLPARSLHTMRGTRGKGPPSPPLPEEEEMSELEGVAGDEEKTTGVTSGAATDATVRRSRSGRGMDSGRSSFRRRGLMSSVLRRNKKHDGGAKISRPEATESAARRDTNLERSAGELAALRSNSLRGRASPRLHKEPTSLATGAGGDWPLGGETGGPTLVEKDLNVVGEGDGGRRSPSALNHSKSQPSMNRPAFLVRRTMSAMSGSGTINTDGVGSDVPGRKKKKFGALRRMFKLDD